MLNIKDLTKKYTKKSTALDSFDMLVQSGDIMGLVGPNGSGKTTLINSLLGVIEPTNGSVNFNNFKLGSEQFYKNIAYVPDELMLPELLTANEYFDFLASVYEISLNRKDLLAEIFQMDSFLDHTIGSYSHGMKKKIQLIAAFMSNVKLIILDEPFRGLDVESIIKLKKIIISFTGGQEKLILLSTHDLLAAEQLCNKISIIYKGKNIANGSVGDILKLSGKTNLEEAFISLTNMEVNEGGYEKVFNSL